MEHSAKLKMTIKCRGGSLCPSENILKTNGRAQRPSLTKGEKWCISDAILLHNWKIIHKISFSTHQCYKIHLHICYEGFSLYFGQLRKSDF